MEENEKIARIIIKQLTTEFCSEIYDQLKELIIEALDAKDQKIRDLRNNFSDCNIHQNSKLMCVDCYDLLIGPQIKAKDQEIKEAEQVVKDIQFLTGVCKGDARYAANKIYKQEQKIRELEEAVKKALGLFRHLKFSEHGAIIGELTESLKGVLEDGKR